MLKVATNKTVYMNTTESISQYDDPLEKAALVAEWLEEKQADKLLGLDARKLSSSFDVMLIVSARNVRHAQALADYVLHGAGEHKFGLLGMEGYKTGQWILVDLNDVIVHIFLHDVREYFNLEGLWSQAPAFLQVQESDSQGNGRDVTDQEDDF